MVVSGDDVAPTTIVVSGGYNGWPNDTNILFKQLKTLNGGIFLMVFFSFIGVPNIKGKMICGGNYLFVLFTFR